MVDAVIEAAIAEFNMQPTGLTFYREVGRVADEQNAVVYLEVVNRETGIRYPGVIDWLYVNYANGTWTAVMPGDANYRAAYRLLSEELKARADELDEEYRTQADPRFAPERERTGYELPFPSGATGTITRSYDLHGKGKIDFDLTAREVSAARDGFIVFANDSNSIQTYQSGAWWYWNTMIIEHGDHQYSLYGHLAPDSIPAWIKDACGVPQLLPDCRVPIQAGDVIGQEGNTGNSTNPHLHVEFGQGFGIVPYLDIFDGDADGDRAEPIFAGYVYAEHNVALNGFSVEEVAAWPYLTVLASEIN
ncbi:MAG: M23 family metallopeptidase [Chloroflexi bacterium]|nr:M23 family metallopeptidase [Chloroflexota bacterium]